MKAVLERIQREADNITTFWWQPEKPIDYIAGQYIEDDGEMDEKLITVPADDVSKDHIKDLTDLGDNFPKVIEHFYKHYKDWKKGWTNTGHKLY